jgi:hypothetical protein
MEGDSFYEVWRNHTVTNRLILSIENVFCNWEVGCDVMSVANSCSSLISMIITKFTDGPIKNAEK